MIIWRPSPGAGTFDRLADSGDEAEAASDIAVSSTTTASGAKNVASIRTGSDTLALIAFDEIDGPQTPSLSAPATTRASRMTTSPRLPWRASTPGGLSAQSGYAEMPDA
jgi:hypothetical protein